MTGVCVCVHVCVCVCVFGCGAGETKRGNVSQREVGNAVVNEVWPRVPRRWTSKLLLSHTHSSLRTVLRVFHCLRSSIHRTMWGPDTHTYTHTHNLEANESVCLTLCGSFSLASACKRVSARGMGVRTSLPSHVHCKCACVSVPFAPRSCVLSGFQAYLHCVSFVRGCFVLVAVGQWKQQRLAADPPRWFCVSTQQRYVKRAGATWPPEDPNKEVLGALIVRTKQGWAKHFIT